MYSRDFGDGVNRNRSRKLSEVFKQDEGRIWSSLQKAYILSVGAQAGFVATGLLQVIDVSCDSVNKLAEASNLLEGMRYIEQKQFYVFRPNFSSSNVGVERLSHPVLVTEPAPPLFLYGNNISVSLKHDLSRFLL